MIGAGFGRWALGAASGLVLAVFGGLLLIVCSASYAMALVTASGAGSAGTGNSGAPSGGVTTEAVVLPITGYEDLPAGFSVPAGTPENVLGAIEFVDRQLGKPYLYGGDGPDAFDCSGLVYEAYLSVGIHIDRTTYAEVDDGTAVAGTADLEPGDLVLIPGSDPEGELPGHVGMYVGKANGQGWIVQAPHTGTVIHATPLADFTPIWDMRRIVAWPTA